MSPNDNRTLRSVEVHILLSVVDEARHGYAILQEAINRTDGKPGFEIPTLYRALRRLKDDGWIRPVSPPTADGDERREYWAATPSGRSVLVAELDRLEAVLSVGRARLGRSVAEGSR